MANTNPNTNKFASAEEALSSLLQENPVSEKLQAQLAKRKEALDFKKSHSWITIKG